MLITKGLSRFQRQILLTAYACYVSYDRARSDRERGADATSRELLVEVYGFPRIELRCSPGDGNRFGGQRHTRRQIGAERYSRAHASLSRALVRLERRGLVCRVCGRFGHWSGINLTDDGIAAAVALGATPELGATPGYTVRPPRS